MLLDSCTPEFTYATELAYGEQVTLDKVLPVEKLIPLMEEAKVMSSANHGLFFYCSYCARLTLAHISINAQF